MCLSTELAYYSIAPDKKGYPHDIFFLFLKKKQFKLNTFRLRKAPYLELAGYVNLIIISVTGFRLFTQFIHLGRKWDGMGEGYLNFD